MLEIKRVEWHMLENGREHHTDKYEMIHAESTPVLRRSQPFRITLVFNKAFNEATDTVRLLFTFDKRAKEPETRLQSLMENTILTSSNQINNSLTEWSIQIERQQNEKVTLLVRSPPTAAWGIWNLTIKLNYKLDSKIVTWKSPTQFWLLFNPWSKDDEVFMGDLKYLDEYVLNDVGKIYTSSSKKPKGMHWIFGQFATAVLKVIKKLMDERELSEEILASPVKLSQELCRVCLIVIGRWSDNYEGGTAPWLWTGSLPIYEEYLKTNTFVRYAQCYVYAGILTTAFRAVGFPSRTVSNFLSSTSIGPSMAVNYVYDSNGDILESSMIWNFHVWNDAWMARPDLPSGYGGWQAVDAMGTGPASLEAIRKGEICYQYGTITFMSECNADKVQWTKTSENEYRLVKVTTDYMGKAMLTKQPFIYDPHGDTDFMDLRNSYKEPEGTKGERLAVYNAIKYCKNVLKKEDDLDKEEEWIKLILSRSEICHVDLSELDESVKFQLETMESVLYGEEFNAVLKIENSKEIPITVEANLGASSTYYNGSNAGLIKRVIKSITIPPKSEGTISMKVQPEEYSAKLVEFTLLRIHCITSVKENNFTWADDFQFNIEMPEIIISTVNDLNLNEEGIVLFQFMNQLKSGLTKCSITYEAPGIGRNVKIPVRDIKAGEEVIIEHKVKPVKSGEILINAIFTSEQLKFLGGSTCLLVN